LGGRIQTLHFPFEKHRELFMIVRTLLSALATLFLTSYANAAATSECLALAEGKPVIQKAAFSPAALEESQVQFTFIGHSTFLIETADGIKIATDFTGYANGVIPDVVTMNHAHSSHYTDHPDPAIKHVLRGWNPEGGPAKHDLQVGDVHIRNVTTDIRGGSFGRIPDGNSIFIFEIAGLCIGHLGHLHHELAPEHIAQIGRLDIVLVPVDGGYTMAQANMLNVLKDLRARVVIPMHYFGPTTLSRFIAGMREEFEVETMTSPTIVLSASTLPERAKFIVLPGY
jgi:L-ascorbate metabolism protein UlaG (beta-lactamase superfamily)